MKHRKSMALTAGTLMAFGMAAPAMADSGAQGAAEDSPGIISGNVIQAPVHIPINVCSNTVDIVGILNPTFGNPCVNS